MWHSFKRNNINNNRWCKASSIISIIYVNDNVTRILCQKKFCSSAFKTYYVSRRKGESISEVNRTDCMPLVAGFS